MGAGNKLLRRLLPLSWLAASGVLLICLDLAGCRQKNPLPIQMTASSVSATAIASKTPTEITPTPTSIAGALPVWQTYAPPTLTPATAVPPPLVGLNLPSEVKVVVFLGEDQDPPYVGRTSAISLLIYNTRLAKASLVTIPGDLYVYIPGYTMQRINVAYPVGGLEMVFQTLQYNLGVRPDHWVVAHPSDFEKLVNEVGGLDVTILAPLPDVCGGISAGDIHMDGSLALCYVRYRQGATDFAADLRQQLLLRLIFLRVVQGGGLVRLPTLYNVLQATVNMDSNLADLMGYIPLALKLGDPQRISYFQIGWDEVTPWQVPGSAQTSVLLPQQQSIRSLMQQAIDAVMVPSPLSDRVSTLVYELTVSPTVTLTIPFTPTLTPTSTITFTPTITSTTTLTPTETETPTITLTPTPGPSSTPTQTLTPTGTMTVIP